MPKYNANINEIIYEEDVLKIYRAARNNYERLLVSVLWLTGARINEMLRIKKEDVAWDGDILFIKIATEKLGNKGFFLDHRILKLEIPITGISVIFIKTIIEMAKITDAGQRICPRKWQWANKTITRLGMETLDEREDMQQRKICPYTFRHSRFSILAFNGYSAWMIKAIKGSKDLRSVEAYVHAVPELMKFTNMNQSKGMMLKKEMTLNMKAVKPEEEENIKVFKDSDKPAAASVSDMLEE